MERNVIGEGSYGCVHKPSLLCKKSPNRNFSYKKHISKIMVQNEAKRELKEFLILGKVDPENLYHLGTPLTCKPKFSKETIDALNDCKYIKASDVEKYPDNYSLLISKYGGQDLHQFFRYSLDDYLSSNKEEKTDKILLAIHNLIMGLKVFKEHGLVHNDLKPQNILFDEETCTMKFIDFGLMREKDTIIQQSKASNNWLGVYHWSYPLECGLMNKDNFNKYANMSDQQKTKYSNTVAECIVFNKKDNDLSIKNPDAYKTVFTYINPSYTVPDEGKMYGYIYSSFNALDRMINNEESYNSILNKITDSIDVYGLGFTLQFIVNCLKRENAIDLVDFTDLSTFCNDMYDFSLQNRITDLDLLLDNYESLLLEIGVLSRLGKSFSNHNLVNASSVPKRIEQHILSPSESRKLSDKLEENAYLNPVTTNSCPNGKERNMRTGRCIKVCAEGYVRNENYRCVKGRKMTRKNAYLNPETTVVSCPKGKERNPRTGRCIKVCREGYIRNEKNRCAKGRKTKRVTVSTMNKTRHRK